MEELPSCLFELVPDEVLLRLLVFLDAASLRAFGATCRALSTLVVHECFRLGVRYQRRRFLDEALAFFSVTLALDPRHAGALDERAICFFNVGDRRGAVRDLRRSAALASTRAEKRMFESVALEMTGRLQEALVAAREAIALDPTCGRAYFELAYVLQELPFRPDHHGAIAAYTAALQHGYARQYVTVFNRGWALEAAGDEPGALEDYRRTLALNPYFSQAARCVMRLLEKRGDTKELRNEAHRCEEAFRDAFVIRKLPAAQCAHFQVQLAQIQDCLGDIDSAIQLYQSAIDAGHPRVSQIHNSRAYLLEQKGDFVEALKEFDLAVSSDCPVSSLVLESRAKFKLRRGNIAGAKEDFRTIANSETGSNFQGFILLALLAKEQNDWQGALQLVESALSRQPLAEMIDARLLQAELFCRLGVHRRALDSYEKIIDFYPNAIIPRKLRGNLFLRLGKPESAKEEYAFASSLKEYEFDEESNLNLGSLLFWENRYSEAVEQFELVLKHSPFDFKALCNRAHTHLKLGNFRETVADYRSMEQRFPGSVSVDMMTALEIDPQSVAKWIGKKNVMFAREHSWEDWMASPAAHCRDEQRDRQEENEAEEVEIEEEFSDESE